MTLPVWHQGWSVEQIGKGQYSTGKKETANMKSDFPWTPTTFVVAKGIEARLAHVQCMYTVCLTHV